MLEPTNDTAGLAETSMRLEQAVGLVAAYVSNNSIRVADLPQLIETVYGALGALAADGAAVVEPEAPAQPAVPIKKSVTPDFIICLEDGKKFRSLKRHLGTVYNLTPDQYRAKWNLPRDYPMVAPAYSAVRSKLAKDIGLGRPTKAASPAAPEPQVAAAPAKKTRTRRSGATSAA